MGKAPSSSQYRSYQKTIVCRFFERGACAFGDDCRFAHPQSTNPTSSSGGPEYRHMDTRLLQGDASVAARKHRESGTHFSKRVYLYADGKEQHGHTGPGGDDDCLRSVSVMSYNILADAYAKQHSKELYSSVPGACLRWSTRARLLEKEISHWAPDIVCLQEVDRFKHIEQMLRPYGYVGRFTPRTNGRPDGLAMFWQKSKFQLDASNDVSYAQYGLRDNVAQIYALKSASPKSITLIISNIHVLFNPKRGDIKIGQVRILMDRMADMMNTRQASSAIMCGDFNSAPSSSLHSYVLTGELDFLESDRRHISGQISCTLRSTAGDGQKKTQKPSKPWKVEEIYLATGTQATGRVRHGLDVKSSYQQILGGEEPFFTTAHDKYIGTVDYIFYSNGRKEQRNPGGISISPSQILAPPPLHAITPKGLPHGFWPSDHVSLLTHFDISYNDA